MKAKVEAHGESGTATEHVKQPQRGTVTEHAEQCQNVALKYNAQTQQHIEEARANRTDDTFKHLAFTLVDVLTHLLQQHCYSHLDFLNIETDGEEIVFEKVAAWCESIEGCDCYDEPEQLPHKKNVGCHDP